VLLLLAAVTGAPTPCWGVTAREDVQQKQTLTHSFAVQVQTHSLMGSACK
jgi:hypothetical protein